MSARAFTTSRFMISDSCTLGGAMIRSRRLTIPSSLPHAIDHIEVVGRVGVRAYAAQVRDRALRRPVAVERDKRPRHVAAGGLVGVPQQRGDRARPPHVLEHSVGAFVGKLVQDVDGDVVVDLVEQRR